MLRGWSLLAGLTLSASVAVAQQPTTIAGRTVFIWRATSPAAAPLVVFSHGFGGCAKQSMFLMEALAQHGYFVIAPNHKDALCGMAMGGGGGGGGRGGRGGGGGRGMRRDVMDDSSSMAPFRKPREWSDTTFADRRNDIVAILDAMRADTMFSNHVYFTQIALIGHSLGGYTVLGMGGGWPAWNLTGVKAILALSPYTEPFLIHGTLTGLTAPVMYQGGTLDLGITPALRRSGGVYDVSPAPKYFVELKGAGHLAWTERVEPFHERIVEYSLAFIDHYVRGTASLDGLHRKESLVSDLRFRDK